MNLNLKRKNVKERIVEDTISFFLTDLLKVKHQCIGL